MGLFDWLFGEFIDVIEWTDDSNDTLVHRFERHDHAIKYGAMLTVRESQVAVLVNEGRIADLYEPGLYRLETNNMPILSTLENWHHGFKSPFKVDVYFLSRRRFTNLKWGTKHPVMLRDPEFGPVRLRAFGHYSMRILEPITFLKEIVGTDGHFQTGEISEQLRNLIASRFAAILGEAGIPVLDLAANYDDLGNFITARLQPEFAEYGLELTKLLVENISLPEAVEKALDQRSSMGILGNLNHYTQFQAARSLTGQGPASEGLSLGAGIALGEKLAHQLNQTAAKQPPPIPNQALYYIAQKGRRLGPWDFATLQEKIREGKIGPETLIWTPALKEWTPAGKVEGIAPLLNPSPPPLPDSGT